MSQRDKLVGINGLFADYEFSGTWTYTRNLVNHLPMVEAPFEYLVALRRGDIGEASQSVRFSRPSWPFPRAGSTRAVVERADKFLWEQVAWPVAMREADLIHSLYFAAPFAARKPLVVTVHDSISLEKGAQHSRAAGIYAKLMVTACRRANFIIAVSNHARMEIAEKLSYPTERIVVVHEAPDPELLRVSDAGALSEVRDRYHLPQRFVLYLGGTEARKNLMVLLEAWAVVREPDVALVLVGRYPTGDPMYPNMEEAARRMSLNRVTFVPFVQQEDLAAVYSAAELFCYPSKYEGFGLPPLEAMACATPVLASNAASLPEVLGSGADLLDPEDSLAWSKRIAELLADPDSRKALAERGAAWVSRYSWTETARQTVGVYEQALAA